MTQDLVIKRNNRTVTIRGWHDRCRVCPDVRNEIERLCVGKQPKHKLLFRADPSLLDNGDPFVIGQKAKPCYAAGDPSKLKRHANRLLNCAEVRATLFDTYANSPMALLGGKLPCQVRRQIEAYWGTLNEPAKRHRFLQLLIYGLQYQNNKPEVLEWRPYLFVLSATDAPENAMLYAAGRSNVEPHSSNYIVEYAPPATSELFVSVKDLLDEAKAYGLDEWYPDRDQEFFVPYAMLPHWVLGYTLLQRESNPSDRDVVYSIKSYQKNPLLFDGTHGLEHPPDLNPLQEVYKDKIAFAYVNFGMRGPAFESLEHAGGQEDIAAPARVLPRRCRPAAKEASKCRSG